MPSRRLLPSGGLNKDVDKYNLPEGDYIDARNVILDTTINGGGGSLKTFPNIEGVTDVNMGDLLDAGWSIKEAVSDNEGIIYVLLIDSDEAVLGKIDLSNTWTSLILYTHEVSTDFQPDMRVIGNVVVWNYHGNGTPLSWLVTRTPVTNGSLVLKDITLIKEPPKMEFSIATTAADAEPTDLAISASTFAEIDASGYTIGTFTVTDTSSATHTIEILSALDDGGNDASSRFTIVGMELRTVGTFNWGTADDRSFTFNIKATNEGGVEYVEPLTITLTNVAPSINDPITASANEGDSIGTVVVSPATLGGNSGSADGTDTGCTYSILSGNGAGMFAIDSSTGEITTASAIDDADTGVYNLVVQIDDGALTDTSNVGITLVNINEAPVTTDGSASNLSTSVYTGDFGALTTDPENDTLTYSTVSGPSSGAITINQVAETFEYIPDGTASSDSFTWKANDGALDSNTSSFSISHQVYDLASKMTYVSGDLNVTNAVINPTAGANQFQGGVSGVPRTLDFDVLITVNGGSVPPDLSTITVTVDESAGADIFSIVERIGTRTSPNSTTIIIGYTLNLFLGQYLNMSSDLDFTYQVNSLT